MIEKITDYVQICDYDYECPESEEGADKMYCESFCLGKGCILLENCKPYQQAKKGV